MNRVVTKGEKESPPPQTRQAGDYGKKKRGRVAKTKGRNLWERFKEYEDGEDAVFVLLKGPQSLGAL